MSTKITESRYSRSATITSQLYILSVVAVSASAILLSVDGEVSIFTAAGFYICSVGFLTLAIANSHQGFCNRMWSLVLDIDWVLDDVDPDGLVDGPVVIDE